MATQELTIAPTRPAMARNAYSLELVKRATELPTLLG